MIIAFAVTHLARHVDIRKKIHLDGFVAIALAGLAPSSFYIEGEASGLVTSHLGFRQCDKEVANVGKHPGIGGRIGTRRTTQWRLVDTDYLVDILQSLDGVVRQGVLQRAIETLGKNGLQGIVDQCRIANS